jgi:UMF1 family MFS transporter
VPAPAAPPRLLARLGLGRPELRAWALYDCANSAAVTSVLTAILPIYFSTVAAAGLAPAEATQRFALATTAGLVVVALLAPLLGALADLRPVKKRLLAAFAALGASACAALFLVEQGDALLAAGLLVLVNVGLNGSFVFYDALLPHVAREDELDRTSAAAYALGYLGGGLLLAAQLAVILRPDLVGLPSGPDASASARTLPTRLAFLSVAIWWAAFTVPLLLGVREPPVAARAPGAHGSRAGPVAALRRLARTFSTLARHRQALLMLVAFLIYNDGIGTIIRMAAIYGTEIGLPRGVLIGAILMVQLVGVPFAFLFGALAGRLGARRAVLGGLAVYVVVAVLAYFTTSAAHFFALAFLVGTVQGGTQALSRSLFASLVPRHLSGEFFAFFAVSEKFAGIFGPAIFAAAIALTGSSRAAILSVIGFFVAGAALLARVDVAGGQREARAAEAAAGLAPAPAPSPASPARA